MCSTISEGSGSVLVLPPAQKEREQAHLPHRELIKVEVVIAAGKAFNVKAMCKSISLGVGKAGLPPLSGRVQRTSLCKSSNIKNS